MVIISNKHGQHQHGPAQNQRTGVALPFYWSSCCSDALPRWRRGKCSLKPQRFLSGGSLSSVVLIVIILTIVIRGFINTTNIPTSIIIFISNIIIAIIASQTNSCFQTFPKEGASPPHSTIASMALMYQVRFDIFSKILFCRTLMY